MSKLLLKLWVKFNLLIASFDSIDSYDFSTLYITLPPYPHKLIKVGHHEILNQIKQLSTFTFTVLTIISLYLLLSVIDSMCYFFVKMNRQFFFIVHLLQSIYGKQIIYFIWKNIQRFISNYSNYLPLLIYHNQFMYISCGKIFIRLYQIVQIISLYSFITVHSWETNIFLMAKYIFFKLSPLFIYYINLL